MLDLVVIGGGIMGLACAFEESLRGKTVAVLDPNPIGQKASWAAAGILAARAGLIGTTPLRELYLQSLYGYTDWLAHVESESGMRVPFERSGDYQIFPLDNAESLVALRLREKQLVREKAIRYSVADELPPFLREHSRIKARVFHFPDEAYIHNRLLMQALANALRKRGATILEKCGSFSIQPAIQTGNTTEIKGGDWTLQTRQVLIAAGAWCNEVLRPLGWSLPLSPVKGQLALLPNFHGKNSMIHCQDSFYLIPRGDQLICGATTEPDVWEEGFDATGNSYLSHRLHSFFPKVKPDWSESWSGLRPRALDRLPLMGWVDEKSGIAICTGHYKTGISLAPVTARCISALLNHEKPPAKLKPFDPLRAEGLKRL